MPQQCLLCFAAFECCFVWEVFLLSWLRSVQLDVGRLVIPFEEYCDAGVGL